MNFEVLAAPSFEKHLKKLSNKFPSVKKDVGKLIDSLSVSPQQGTSLGKDCYKIRLAITSKGKGKSGGGRVITCVKVVQRTVYLLSIYDKSEQDSISDMHLDNLLRISGLM
jgi:mRNA-degrading endonuclease RelE of RelBE toxin-antitoxin system